MFLMYQEIWKCFKTCKVCESLHGIEQYLTGCLKCITSEVISSKGSHSSHRECFTMFHRGFLLSWHLKGKERTGPCSILHSHYNSVDTPHYLFYSKPLLSDRTVKWFGVIEKKNCVWLIDCVSRFLIEKIVRVGEITPAPVANSSLISYQLKLMVKTFIKIFKVTKKTLLTTELSKPLQ